MIQSQEKGNIELFRLTKEAKVKKKRLNDIVRDATTRVKLIRRDLYLLKHPEQLTSESLKEVTQITETNFKYLEKAEHVNINGSLLDKPNNIRFQDLHYRSGGYAFRHSLQRAKNLSSNAQVRNAEAILSENSLQCATYMHEVITRFGVHQQQKQVLWRFYYGPALYDHVCASERRYGQQQKLQMIFMFVGDRGYDYGSRIKRNIRFGGLYSSVLVTNEYNTSQVCGFCFQKIHHPFKIVEKKGTKSIKTINDTSVCSNNECTIALNNISHMARGSLSALLIGISGGSRLILNRTLPVFNPCINTN
ncbi:MAG: hypothetical protein EXX96DRAFT_627145 [Benjaminiella poitrasii]|nr:MAG: hypothetical protein EXX96DRAFT_627145 [Benjaminiella poitrasii]